MTTQQKINWGLGVLFIVSLLYLSKNKSPKIEVSELDKNLILSNGSSGAEVAQLQTLLKDNYGAYLGESGENNDGIDGIFGSLTLSALKKYKGVDSITLNQFNL